MEEALKYVFVEYTNFSAVNFVEDLQKHKRIENVGKVQNLILTIFISTFVDNKGFQFLFCGIVIKF